MDTTRLPDGGVNLDPAGGALPTLPASAANAIARDPSDGYLKRWTGAAWVTDLTPTPTATTIFRTQMATQWGSIQPNANVAAGDVSGYGLLDGNNMQNDGGSRSDFDQYGKFVEIDRNNTNPEVYVVASANTATPTVNPLGAPENTPIMALRANLEQLNDTRCFIGMSSELTLTGVPFIGSDAPASDYIGFQFSGLNLRNDTNWQLVRDGAPTGGSQTIVDTGVLADETPYVFEIDWVTSTSCVCSIYDATYTTVVWTSGVLTTDLLGASRELRAGITTQYTPAGTISIFRFYRMDWMNR